MIEFLKRNKRLIASLVMFIIFLIFGVTAIFIVVAVIMYFAVFRRRVTEIVEYDVDEEVELKRFTDFGGFSK